ncbi:TPA_asm: hypothetical protein [Physarum slime mold MELD virus]|nr:TPA_asm: hypothetical protein [Physarum slime mold MELD virus]
MDSPRGPQPICFILPIIQRLTCAGRGPPDSPYFLFIALLILLAGFVTRKILSATCAPVITALAIASGCRPFAPLVPALNSLFFGAPLLHGLSPDQRIFVGGLVVEISGVAYYADLDAGVL